MPTNVPPQYYEAEERFRAARTPQARIAALQEMLAIMPKHKGTDHLKAQLRARLARLMEELEGSSRGSRGGRTEPFSLPKDGRGRAVLIGPANVGKSLLLSRATGAQTRVGAFAMSTLEPTPGMLLCNGVPVQLVDTPPISSPRTQSRLYGLLRTSDVFVVVVDLVLDPVAQVNSVFASLREWGFEPRGREGERDGGDQAMCKPTVVVGNKADLHGALDGFQALDAALGEAFPVVMTSAEDGVGLDGLAWEVFRALRVVRVYPKPPRERLEDLARTDPLVLPLGSTVVEAAEQLHKGLGRGLKYAILWGRSGKFQGQRVGRDHKLSDEDVLELHA